MQTFSLTGLFGMEEKEIYYISNHIEAQYTQTAIPKRSGGSRTIYIPNARLRYLQRIILREFLSDYSPSPAATAYHPGAAPAENARPHLQKPYLLKTDICNFFDNIGFGQVYAVFAQHLPARYAKLFAELTCYRDHLVQGAPTSPALSNLVMRRFDQKLLDYCAAHNLTYTRYCDDITLSGAQPLTDAYHFVQKELAKMGFTLNGRKTHFVNSHHRQTVTGIAVNTKLQAPTAYRRKLRQDLYYLYKYGPENVICWHRDAAFIQDDRPQCEKYLLSLLGRINYVLQIDPANTAFQNEKEKLQRYMRTHGYL